MDTRGAPVYGRGAARLDQMSRNTGTAMRVRVLGRASRVDLLRSPRTYRSPAGSLLGSLTQDVVCAIRFSADGARMDNVISLAPPSRVIRSSLHSNVLRASPSILNSTVNGAIISLECSALC